VLLLVAITVDGGGEGAEELVVAGCQAALGSDGCIPSSAAAGVAESLLAEVTIADSSVTVAVEMQGGGHALRELSFSPEDSAEQRATAGGLLVAALAAELERVAAARAVEASSVRPPPPNPSPGPQAASDSEAPRARQWLIDVGAYASAPLGSLAVHLGGEAQVGYFPSARFALVLGARGDTALPGGLDASRLALGLGPAVELLPQAHRLSLLVALEGRIEELRLGGGQSEPAQASVLRGGGALTARFGFPTLGAGFYAGLEAALIGPEVDVYIGSTHQGQVPLASFSLLFGGRLASFRP